MRLKTYIILAVIAFLAVTAWIFDWNWSMALFAIVGLGAMLLFYYPLYRLFFAIVNRLER